MNEECAELERRFAELARDAHLFARLQGLGGQFGVYFTDEEVTNYRTACKADPARFGIFQEEMLREGIYTLPIPTFHHGLVAAHSQYDIEEIISAMKAGLEKVHQLKP